MIRPADRLVCYRAFPHPPQGFLLSAPWNNARFPILDQRRLSEVTPDRGGLHRRDLKERREVLLHLVADIDPRWNTEPRLEAELPKSAQVSDERPFGMRRERWRSCVIHKGASLNALAERSKKL